jgi:hypothetical protein
VVDSSFVFLSFFHLFKIPVGDRWHLPSDIVLAAAGKQKTQKTDKHKK